MAGLLTLRFLAPAAPLGWLVVRAGGGALLALHGWHKVNVQGVSSFSAWLASMDVPLPDVAAWAAVGAELVGGVLLVLGLFTRWAGLVVAGNMGVALYLAHRDTLDLSTFGSSAAVPTEYPLLLALLGLGAALHGGGRLSLDGPDTRS